MWYAARILQGSFYALSLAEGYVVVRSMGIISNFPKAALPRFSPFWVRTGVKVRVIGLGLGVGLGWVYARTSIRQESAFWLASADSTPPPRSGWPTCQVSSNNPEA